MKTICTFSYEAKTVEGDLVTAATSTEVLSDETKAVALKNIVASKLLEIGVELGTEAAKLSQGNK